MKLYPENTLFGLRYKQWTYLEAFAYCLKGMMREHPFFEKQYEKIVVHNFTKKWLVQNSKESYFDIKGIKLPNISNSYEKLRFLAVSVMEDVFLFPCFLDDNYDKTVVELFDRHMSEGPYGYTDGAFDVTVKKKDIVIDAGAWIGDFSAYAVSKNATVYAFEPVNSTFQLLCKTKSLNNVNGGGILPYSKRIKQS